MKLNHSSQRSPRYPRVNKVSLTEIVAADTGDFQIVVPSMVKTVKQPFFSSHLWVPKRTYSREGWIIYCNQIVGTLINLTVGDIVLPSEHARSIKRIAPAVPMAFEAYSPKPLPFQVLKTACFAYQFAGAESPYYSVFRKILPRFVRLYPLQNLLKKQILGKVQQLCREEKQFVAENRQQLKQVPFYREKFDLFDV